MNKVHSLKGLVSEIQFYKIIVFINIHIKLNYIMYNII